MTTFRQIAWTKTPGASLQTPIRSIYTDTSILIFACDRILAMILFMLKKYLCGRQFLSGLHVGTRAHLSSHLASSSVSLQPHTQLKLLTHTHTLPSTPYAMMIPLSFSFIGLSFLLTTVRYLSAGCPSLIANNWPPNDFDNGLCNKQLNRLVIFY